MCHNCVMSEFISLVLMHFIITKIKNCIISYNDKIFIDWNVRKKRKKVSNEIKCFNINRKGQR